MQLNLFSTILILLVLFSCENEPCADGHMDTWTLGDLFWWMKSSGVGYSCDDTV